MNRIKKTVYFAAALTALALIVGVPLYLAWINQGTRETLVDSWWTIVVVAVGCFIIIYKWEDLSGRLLRLIDRVGQPGSPQPQSPDIKKNDQEAVEGVYIRDSREKRKKRPSRPKRFESPKEDNVEYVVKEFICESQVDLLKNLQRNIRQWGLSQKVVDGYIDDLYSNNENTKKRFTDKKVYKDFLLMTELMVEWKSHQTENYRGDDTYSLGYLGEDFLAWLELNPDHSVSPG